MNWWGYVIIDAHGKVLCEDFGYETEEDALKFGKNRIRRYTRRGIKVTVVAEQHWRDLED